MMTNPDIFLGIVCANTILTVWIAFKIRNSFRKNLLKMIRAALQAYDTFFSQQTSDLEKEENLFQLASQLLSASALASLILSGLTIVYFLPGFAFYLLASTSLAEVITYYLNPYPLILLISLIILRSYLARRKTENLTYTTSHKYSEEMQLLHRIIFPLNSKLLHYLDKSMSIFQKRENLQYVFIIGLARSGSTALLNYLNYCIPNACSYQYRDMPLVTAPFINRFFFHQKIASQQENMNEIIWMDYRSQ